MRDDGGSIVCPHIVEKLDGQLLHALDYGGPLGIVQVGATLTGKKREQAKQRKGKNLLAYASPRCCENGGRLTLSTSGRSDNQQSPRGGIHHTPF
jgi:hypothetical protein